MIQKPWSVQLEMSEGCNRLCTFCGLNGIRSAPGNFKFMSQESAIKIAEGLGRFAPEARYEFAMHGEPLANPEWESVVHWFRHFLPKAQIQITTNGIVTLKQGMQKVFDKAFSLGVDFIVLDTYAPERERLLPEVAKLQGMTVVDFYREWLPAKKSPWANYHRKLNHHVIVMDDISLHQGEAKQRVIMNHAGNNPTAPKLEQPLKKTCTIPFREMSVCWNGNVNICCMDWQHEYTVGNLVTQTPEQVWMGRPFEAARAMLQSKSRAFTPCDKCDAGAGSRAGLLPKYPAPTADDHAVIAATVKASRGYDARDFIQLRRK